MFPLLRLFLDITIRRRGPEHLPDSSLLLSLTVSAAVVVDGLSLWVTGLDPTEIVPVLIAATLFPVGFTAIVLASGRHMDRLRRTLTGVFAVSVVIETVHLPVRAFAARLREVVVPDPETGTTLADGSMLAQLSPETLQILVWLVIGAQVTLLVWRVAAYGWVFERAMEKDLLYGTAMSGTMLVIHTIVLSSL